MNDLFGLFCQYQKNHINNILKHLFFNLELIENSEIRYFKFFHYAMSLKTTLLIRHIFKNNPKILWNYWETTNAFLQLRFNGDLVYKNTFKVLNHQTAVVFPSNMCIHRRWKGNEMKYIYFYSERFFKAANQLITFFLKCFFGSNLYAQFSCS